MHVHDFQTLPTHTTAPNEIVQGTKITRLNVAIKHRQLRTYGGDGFDMVHLVLGAHQNIFSVVFIGARHRDAYSHQGTHDGDKGLQQFDHFQSLFFGGLVAFGRVVQRVLHGFFNHVDGKGATRFGIDTFFRHDGGNVPK
jgi:hypothetical protein